MRQFARLTLLGAIPDESTILHFRHLLEQNEIAPQIQERVNAHLGEREPNSGTAVRRSG
jgi:transposase, IS5 family